MFLLSLKVVTWSPEVHPIQIGIPVELWKIPHGVVPIKMSYWIN